ncbi:MAG: hypothetical protein ACI4KR_09790 [Ruminiclostridium sp.]
MATSSIILKDGTRLKTYAVYSGNELFQGAYRSTLDIRTPETAMSFEEAKRLFCGENITEITISEISDGGVESLYLYSDYSLVMELALKNTDELPQFSVKLAQKSALEIAQEEQAAILAEQQAALIELAGLIG